MNTIKQFCGLAGISLSLVLSAQAAVQVDPMFSDGMVLQREMPGPIWGKASKGETITVSFRGQSKEVQADAQGKWMLKLDPLELGDPSQLTVKASNTVTFSDVLVGEVWMGSGQSNMEWAAKKVIKKDPPLKEWSQQTHPNVRLYTKKGWVVANPETIPEFSGLGFSFAYTLNQKLNVPVGMMVSAKGAQPSIRWITKEMAMASNSEHVRFIASQAYMDEKNRLGTIRREWEIAARKIRAEGNDPGPKPPLMQNPGDLWDSMVSKHVPYAIRGVLWDQGEAGTAIKDADQFTAMTALLAGWRKAWGQGDFPFLHVQKDSGGGCAFDPQNPINYNAFPFSASPRNPPRPDPKKLARRLDHVRMANLHNAPLVTAFDLDTTVRPTDKSSYGQRASRVAMGYVYGKDIAIYGPLYTSHSIEGQQIRITYDQIGEGLTARHSDTLQGFEIAGADGKWLWADAQIDGDTVVLQNASIPEPQHARYAAHWRSNYANLFNQDGMPALVFSTELTSKK